MSTLISRTLLSFRKDPSEIFSTDHLMKDLKTRSARGGALTMMSQGGKMSLQICSTAVLARILVPADFGLIAMVAVFTGFVALFQDLGLSMATVQREKITHEQVSTLFWINVVLSVILAMIGVALSPLVAWFYGEPELVWITIAISSAFIFGGLGAQHMALLRRQMRFKAIAVAEISGNAFGVTIAIILAVMGAGYWALVAMSAATVFGISSLAFLMSGWVPGLPRRGSDVMPMIKYGGALTGTNMLTFINRQFDNVMIGAFWGAGALGLYAKAYGLLYQPIKQINGPLSSVAVTALSRLQDDHDRFRNYFRKGNQALMFIGMPIVGGCFVATEAIIAVMLGDQWDSAVPIFRYLAPAALVGTTYTATTWAYLALAQTGRQLKWRILDCTVTVIGIAIGVQYGAAGVALGFSIAVTVIRPFELWYCYRKMPLTLMDFVRAAWVPFTATMGTVAAMTFLWHGGEWVPNPFARMASELALFAVLYLVIVCVLPGGRQIFHNFKSLKR